MIHDRHVDFSLTTLLAWAAWCLVAWALLAAWVFDEHEVMLTSVGLVCAAAAATLHVRSFMCVFSVRMKAAFDLGREVERQHQRERELHSV